MICGAAKPIASSCCDGADSMRMSLAKFCKNMSYTYICHQQLVSSRSRRMQKHLKFSIQITQLVPQCQTSKREHISLAFQFKAKRCHMQSESYYGHVLYVLFYVYYAYNYRYY